jgi:hypothetical protein
MSRPGHVSITPLERLLVFSHGKAEHAHVAVTAWRSTQAAGDSPGTRARPLDFWFKLNKLKNNIFGL